MNTRYQTPYERARALGFMPENFDSYTKHMLRLTASVTSQLLVNLSEESLSDQEIFEVFKYTDVSITLKMYLDYLCQKKFGETFLESARKHYIKADYETARKFLHKKFDKKFDRVDAKNSITWFAIACSGNRSKLKQLYWSHNNE